MQKITLVLILLFLGCSVKEKNVYVVIKSPLIRVSDQGFIKKGFGYKEIVIYKAAQKPIKILLKNSTVCVDGKCYDKEKFIKKICKKCEVYILDRLLDKEPLDRGKIIKTSDGFIQKNKDFIYKVDTKKVLFKGYGVVILIKNL